MSEITVNKYKENNIQLHLIPSDKFKTITVVVKFKAPLEQRTVTKRSLIPFVLQQGTATYPSEKQLRMKLDELYGAILQIDRTKKGTNHIIHFQLEFANEKFINSTNNLTDEALQLLYEIIYKPRVADSGFNESVIQREKRQLENKIKSIYDNKIAYANERLIDEMYENEPYSIKKDGYIEDLQTIDGKNLYAYYKQMLLEDDIDIYVLGDFTSEEMKNKVTALFSRNRAEEQTKVIKKEKVEHTKPKKIVEHDSINQAKLHIGYRTNCTYSDEEYPALQVFNGLFGGFPNSKLFLNVREKHSLAYYIASRIESHIGLLIVYSGVETAEHERTYTIIEEQFEQLRSGQFTDIDLETVKDLIISQIKETLDHPAGTIEILYQQAVAETEMSPQSLIQKITRVTKEEVIEIANKITLDTIYVLAGEAGE